jgi:hypothetical protein
MPRTYNKLERYVPKAFQQALADERSDVADHVLSALEALDPEFEGRSMRAACRSILERTCHPDQERAPLRH